MTRKKFLKQLKTELFFHLCPHDRKSVLEDYSEYFDAALEEGKSEEEICRQLGDAKKLAKEIIGIDDKKRLTGFENTVSKLDSLLGNVGFAKAITILPLIIGAVLWISRRGWIFWKHIQVFWNLNADVLNSLGADAMQLGPAATGNIALFMSLFLSLGIACLLWSKRNTTLRRIFEIPLFAGLCVSLGCIYAFLGNMDAPPMLPHFLKTMIPLLCGAVVSVIIFFVWSRPARNGEISKGK